MNAYVAYDFVNTVALISLAVLVMFAYSVRIILRGRTTTYYVKQLAQHGVRDIFPQICLENVIAVEDTFGGPPRAA